MAVLWSSAHKEYISTSEPMISVQILGPNARLAPQLEGRVIHLKVKASSTRMSKIELTLYNEDGALSESAALSKGTRLRIQYGYSGWLSKPRIFRIKKIKGTRAKVRNVGRLTVEAYSTTSALHGSKRSRKWSGLTHNQIASRIAQSYGLEVLLAPEDGVRRTYLQSSQTDAQFLAEVSQKNGLIFAVENDTLLFARPEDIELTGPVAAYTYYVEGEGDGWMTRFEPESNILSIPGAVRVVSTDPKTKRRVEFTAKIKDNRRRVLGEYAELVGDEKIEARLDARLDAALQAETTPNTLTVTLPNLTLGQCKEEAEKRLRSAQGRALKARAGMVGNPDTWCHQMVLIYGIGQQMSGLWRIIEFEGDIGPRGFTMLLKVRRDGLSSKPRGIQESKVQKAKTPAVAKQLISPTRRQPLAVSAQSGVASRSRFVRR